MTQFIFETNLVYLEIIFRPVSFFLYLIQHFPFPKVSFCFVISPDI